MRAEIFKAEKNIITNDVILTDRDLDVLQLLVEMKFADSMQVKKFCFDKTRTGSLRESDKYIKHRLGKLLKAGYLDYFLRPNGNDYIYKASRLGCDLLKSLRPAMSDLKLNTEIKVSEFNHDWHVTQSRYFLEKSGRATSWNSERAIKARFNIFDGLAAKYIPDGLFINKLGELTAFELEISRKAKPRYEDKIQKYVSLIRSHFNEDIKFRRVLYITQTDGVHKLLTEKTKIHSDIFKVESYEQLMVAK